MRMDGDPPIRTCVAITLVVNFRGCVVIINRKKKKGRAYGCSAPFSVHHHLLPTSSRVRIHHFLLLRQPSTNERITNTIPLHTCLSYSINMSLQLWSPPPPSPLILYYYYVTILLLFFYILLLFFYYYYHYYYILLFFLRSVLLCSGVGHEAATSSTLIVEKNQPAENC